MKIAVSLPDEIGRAATDMAKKLNVSRSELVTRALRKLLEEHDEKTIRSRLDSIYESEDSALESGLSEAQSSIIAEDDEW